MSLISIDKLSLKHRYVLYRDDVEEIDPDESEIIDKIIQAMAKGGQLTCKKYGKSVRTSHAKAHGLLRGTLRVPEGFPDYLRQSLFAAAKSYGVIAQLAHVLSDLDDECAPVCKRMKRWETRREENEVLSRSRAALRKCRTSGGQHHCP